ncbi:hypothetical protein KTR9_4440 [Gordonia sp. KTR9]|nr:hypothetical protein KTR9_4440 [Gordonia sp. KTR9]
MAMLQSVVIPVLPALQRELGTDPVGITWVLTSFLLSASVCTPSSGAAEICSAASACSSGPSWFSP